MKPVAWFGIAALVLLLTLAWMLRGLEPGVVALQLAFGPRTFGEIVHGWGDQGLAVYRRHLFVDYALLACYGAFGWLLARRTALFAGFGPRLRAAAATALPLAAVFDAIENALHLWLTEVPRFGVAWVYAVAATAASAKWLLILAFAALVAFVLARRRPEA